MLVACDECGGQVSDRAETCPGCGVGREIFLGANLRCTECGGAVRSAYASCGSCGAPSRLFTSNTTNEDDAVSANNGQPREVANVDDQSENTTTVDRGKTSAGLWARYLAKQLDFGLLIWPSALATQLLLLSIVPGMFDYSGEFEGPWLVYGIITLAFSAFLEAIIVSCFRTTLGKRLAGISLSSQNGGRLRFSTSIVRSLRALIQGMGFGVPIIALFTQLSAFQYVKQNGVSGWDEGTGALYHSREISNVRWFFLIIFASAMIVLMTAISVLASNQNY